MGIELTQSPATIINNEFRLHPYTAVFCDSSDATIARNTFRDCGAGITCIESTVDILNNEIGRDVLYVCRAIECVDGSSAFISGNHMYLIEHEAIFCYSGALSRRITVFRIMPIMRCRNAVPKYTKSRKTEFRHRIDRFQRYAQFGCFPFSFNDNKLKH